MKRHGLSAFTMVEMLVVLVILGLISTLLIQMLGYTLQLRERVLKQISAVREDTLTESWFRQTLMSATPGPKVLETSFQGTSKLVSALTLMPLDRSPGIAERVEWRLEVRPEGIELRYRSDSGNDWLVHHWASKKAAFRYLDEKDVWHEQWPPLFGETGNRLPKGILLTVEDSRFPVVWFVGVGGRLRPATQEVLDG